MDSLVGYRTDWKGSEEEGEGPPSKDGSCRENPEKVQLLNFHFDKTSATFSGHVRDVRDTN